jgi:hypothetical protein
VLILPQEHAQQLAERRRFSRRERRLLAGVLAAVLALVVVVVIALGSGSPTSGNGCVHVNLPYSTGGSEIYACGAQARTMCASVGRPGAYTGATAARVANECRKAGVPVPPGAAGAGS